MTAMKRGMVATVLVPAIGSASHSGPAMAATGDQKQQAADAAVAKTGDPMRYVADQRAQVAVVKEGMFGKPQPGDLHHLDTAERDIARPVFGREGLSDLNQADRVTVYNTHKTIASIACGEPQSRLASKQHWLSGTLHRPVHDRRRRRGTHPQGAPGDMERPARHVPRGPGVLIYSTGAARAPMREAVKPTIASNHS